MAKFDLVTIIRIAPIADELKKKLLSKLETFDVDQKYELSKVLWNAIAEVENIELLQKTDKLLQEVREGKREYNVNDFTEAKAKLTYDLTQKAEEANAGQLLEETRQSLKAHLNK